MKKSNLYKYVFYFISNDNVPRVFVAGHQNWGRGELKNKIDDVLDILDNKKCHVLGISERTMDDASYNILTNHGYEIEVKEDSPRISVIIDKDINYMRRKDLETRECAIIWIELGMGRNRMLVGNYYREWKRHHDLRPWTDHPEDQYWRFQHLENDWERILQTSDCEVHLI